MTKIFYSNEIKKIIVLENSSKEKILTKRSFNGLLNIFQNGSIHDLKTASIRYNVAK